MDINEKATNLVDDMLGRKNVTDVRTPFVKGNDIADSEIIWFPIVKELEISIPIPEGYQLIPRTQVTVQTSFDQHNIKAVTIKEKIPVDLNFVDASGNTINIDTSAEIYLIKLVGNLYYNAVVGDYEPIKTSFSDRNTRFSMFGGIPMNVELGYASDLNYIPSNIEDSLTYNIVSSSSGSANLSKMSASSKQVSAMAIPEFITVSFAIVVSYNEGPIT